jgi:hypothetical protein
MDLLRSCYTITMQFDQAGTIKVPVTWYFCADGASVFPGEHLYGSSNWQPDGQSDFPGPGEVWQTNPPYSKGANPGLPGSDGPCGKLSWWREGVPAGTPPLPVDAQGLPLCCPTRSCVPWFPMLASYTLTTTEFPWSTTSVNYDPPDLLSFIYFPGFAVGNVVFTPAGACGGLQAVTCFVNLLDFGYGADDFTLGFYDSSTYTSVWLPPIGGNYPVGFSVVLVAVPA